MTRQCGARILFTARRRVSVESTRLGGAQFKGADIARASRETEFNESDTGNRKVRTPRQRSLQQTLPQQLSFLGIHLSLAVSRGDSGMNCHVRHDGEHLQANRRRIRTCPTARGRVKTFWAVEGGLGTFRSRKAELAVLGQCEAE